MNSIAADPVNTRGLLAAPQNRSLLWVSIMVLLLCVVLPGSAQRLTVTAFAGDFDRSNTWVRFPLSNSIPVLIAENANGSMPGFLSTDRKTRLQIDTNGMATFQIPYLAKGKKTTYEFALGEKQESRGLEVKREETKVKIRSEKGTLLEYQAEPGKPPREDIKAAFVRGGYIHPLYTPGGKMVTDDFPANHIHHHGVWFPWTHTEFQGRKPDFWNMGEGKGRVEFVALDRLWTGPLQGGFASRHQFVDLSAASPIVALRESWEVAAYQPANDATFWMFDLVSAQECATSDPLILPEYHYGGLGFRGNWNWNGKTNVTFLTSEGETDRIKGNSTRGKWCDISGMVEGKLAGITILGHPGNYRFPQPMRLHPTEPFFCFAPQQLGEMRIVPGQKYESQYRFVIHDGALSAKEIEALWNDYASPPRIEAEYKK